MVSACCWRGSLCFDKGSDRDFVLYISLFLRVLGWWAGVCLYTRVHTHKLLAYLMYTVYYFCIYAGLWVFMIWADCLFLLTFLFL